MEHGTTTITGRVIDEHTGIVDVEGDMNAGSEDELMRAYAAACGASTKGVVLNFDKLDFLNSGGIGLLVTLLVRAHRNGQRVGACGLSAHYQEIFQLTRLDDAIAIHGSEADALAAVTR
ncbi:MAG: STAS domain-containing protein [Acidimicrobiales bacterium]